MQATWKPVTWLGTGSMPFGGHRLMIQGKGGEVVQVTARRSTHPLLHCSPCQLPTKSL
jgi:hypothetical protein